MEPIPRGLKITGININTGKVETAGTPNELAQQSIDRMRDMTDKAPPPKSVKAEDGDAQQESESG